MISACQGECLEEFAPLKATPDAQPWGDTGPLLIGVMALCSGPIGVIRYQYKADKAPGDAIAHDI